MFSLAFHDIFHFIPILIVLFYKDVCSTGSIIMSPSNGIKHKIQQDIKILSAKNMN